ncbi:MAG: manganese catalase family protein [Bacilli bacterium]|nr:manganese catalase family protein [Bacilli bacterium]
MFSYQKRLQYPVNIKKKDLRMAKYLVTQYGGPNGELGAALRYLNQRMTMPDNKGKALLNDIGTEELGHVEMLETMIYQLMKDATLEEIKAAGLDTHYAEHAKALFPTDANGIPFTAAYFATTGDPLADLSEDMAAEQKARAVYENLIELTNDPDVIGPLLWLRQREVVHYARFKELFEEYQKMLPNGENTMEKTSGYKENAMLEQLYIAPNDYLYYNEKVI